MNLSKYKIAPYAILFTLIIAFVAFAQPEAAKLIFNRPLESRIKTGGTSKYRISLMAGDFLRVTVKQQGVDVAVRLIAPDGKAVAERDRPNGMYGEESLSAEVLLTGEHVLEVAAYEADGTDGKCIIRIELPRPLTSVDKLRIGAEIAFQDAETLSQKRTKESRTNALIKYEEALRAWHSLNDIYAQGLTLSTMGFVKGLLGNNQEAVKLYNLALAMHRRVHDERGEALTLSNLGLVYADLGESQLALKCYSQSLPLFRRFHEKRGESTTLNNIGKIYGDLGDHKQALRFYNQSVIVRRQISNKGGASYTFNDNSGVAYTLNNIGAIYSALGEKQRALEFYNEAKGIFHTIGDKRGEAMMLDNSSTVYSALGDKTQALKYYNEALILRRQVGDKLGEATTLNNLGKVYADLGDNQHALDLYYVALPMHRQVGDKRGEASTLNNLMYVWDSQNYRSLAILYGKQSVNAYQELRAKVSSLDKEIQRTYLKSIESTYRKLADLLVESGRISEAEAVLAMLKDEELFAYLRRDDEVASDLKGRISLSPEERKAFEDYEQVADEITRTAREFGVLDKKRNALPLGQTLAAADQQQFDTLKQKYDAAVIVFNAFLNDLKAKFGTNDKRVAVVESDTQGILKRLDQPKTVIISTIVGEDRLNLIVTTADTQRAHTVDITAVDLNKLVAEFRGAVKDPNVDPRPLGKKLYDTLFPADLQKDLDGINTDTIVWSLDGTLRYVPMAALWDGKQYLVERYTNAVLTLASRDKLNASVTDRTKWLALGVGVSKQYQTFPALAAVPQELCSIVRDPRKKEFCAAVGKQQAGVIGGLMLPDDEFTRQSFENNIGKVPVVHIASHFSLNAGNESDSYLLLGGGAERRFSIADLRKTRLDKLELLTLSACNTAMSAGDNSSGVEIEGFGALAQNQGAKTILATLWSVADDSTRDLMTEFYTRLETDSKIGKAEALRRSQLALLTGSHKTGETSLWRRSELVGATTKDSLQPKFKTDPKSRFAHPFYWSPFVLSGNWR